MSIALGNPALFSCSASANLQGLTVPFSPVQSGSGDPSPSNVRPITGWTNVAIHVSGKNLFDVTTYPIQTGKVIWAGNGTVTYNDNYDATGFIPCDRFAGMTVTLNKRPGGESDGIAFYTANEGHVSDIFISGIANNNGTANTPWTFDVPSNAKYMRLTLPSGATEIQIELGTQSTTYEAFNSITDYYVDFPPLGNNLFGAPIVKGTINSTTGVSTASNTRVRSEGYIQLEGGYSYTISATGVTQAMILVYDETGAYKQPESLVSFANLPRSITLTNDRNVRFVFRKSSNDENIVPSDVSNIMLNQGTSAQTYEPFINTIYGGELNALTGVLTINYGEIDSYNGESLPGLWMSDRDVYASGTTPTTGAQVVYALSPPTSGKRFSQTIPSLVGTNVLWTNTNRSNTVMYNGGSSIYFSKILLNGVTLIDLTSDTVDATHLSSGYTAHDASGAPITGSL